MTFWTYIEALLFPPLCIACNELTDVKEPFCSKCGKAWAAWSAKGCPQCGLPASQCQCLPQNLKHLSHLRTVSAFFYDSKDQDCVANRLIYILKQKNDRRTVRFLAERMAEMLLSAVRSDGTDLSEYRITYPPRSPAAIRKYGYDHTRLLAKVLSRELKLPAESHFNHLKSAVQKTLTAKERLRNAVSAYEIKDPSRVKDGKFILIDDVMTSGATLGVCETLLSNAGARDVILCTAAKDI